MLTLKMFVSILPANFVLLSIVSAQVTSSSMGPVAFLWPPDRPWSEAYDNVGPCGSSSGVGQRTPFPLTNGRLALVAQNDTRAVHVSISYKQDPAFMSDFIAIYGPEQVGDLDVGHTCITVPTAPSYVLAGSNATFGVLYVSEEDEGATANEIFYACADISFVETSAFTAAIPCFNATESDPTVEADGSVSVSSLDNPHETEDKTSNKGLEGGQVAGIVVGTVLGVALLAFSAVLILRRKRRGRQTRSQFEDKASDTTLTPTSSYLGGKEMDNEEVMHVI